MGNLVLEWQAAVEARGLTLSEGLEELSAELRCPYDLARLGQWRRGARLTPQPVVCAMQRTVLAGMARPDGVLGRILGPKAGVLAAAISAALEPPNHSPPFKRR